jgi:hypothetical protein
MGFFMGNEIVAGLHMYQPIRGVKHELFNDISTDPEGKDWTAIIDSECYRPLAELGLLSLASFDINSVLLLELEERQSGTPNLITDANKDNAVGSSYIHPILPDLCDIDKKIVVGAGVVDFINRFGTQPKVFWPPETAMDISTAQVLSDFGYEAFLCAPEQIKTRDGSPADNQPVLIHLPDNGYIVAIPFDRPASSAFAFNEKYNAHSFMQDHLLPQLRNVNHGRNTLVTWTDCETFGHHWKNGDSFLNELLRRALPQNGVSVVSINNLDISKNLLEGTLIERTSWSCPHIGLKRWHTSCDCTENKYSWKDSFYKTFEGLNSDVGATTSDELGEEYSELMMEYFGQGLLNPGPPNTDPRMSLISANVASLTARTSCATFFDNPYTSGLINILFGHSAIQHLRDAGLSRDADRIEDRFVSDLVNVRDPIDGRRTGRDIAESLLEKRAQTVRS